jgi:hypothetical protein
VWDLCSLTTLPAILNSLSSAAVNAGAANESTTRLIQNTVEAGSQRDPKSVEGSLIASPRSRGTPRRYEIEARQKVAKHAAKIFTLESTHPTRKAITYRKGQRRLCSPLQATVREYVGRIRPYAENPLQSNPAWAKPPWTSYGNRVEIQERSEALDTSRLLRIAGFPTLYTDAASGKRLTGCVTVLARGQELRVVQKKSIGWSSTASVLGAELAAIEYAWKHINNTRLVIMSDSQHALRAIAQGYSHGSKQA